MTKKGKLLKALFSFILSLLNSDLPSYGSNSKKRCTLRLLSMCLEEGGVLEIVLPGSGQTTYLGEGMVCLGDWRWGNYTE